MVIRFSTRLLLLVRIGGFVFAALLALGIWHGLAYWKFPPAVAVPLFFAAKFIVLVGVPVTFPSHKLYDMAKKMVDLSDVQVLIGGLVMVVEYLLASHFFNWLKTEYFTFYEELPPIWVLYVLAHVMATILVYLTPQLVFPMTYEEAEANVAMELEVRAQQKKVEVLEAASDLKITKVESAETIIAIITDKIIKGEPLSDQDLMVYQLLMAAEDRGERSLPGASRPALSDEARRMLPASRRPK